MVWSWKKKIWSNLIRPPIQSLFFFFLFSISKWCGKIFIKQTNDRTTKESIYLLIQTNNTVEWWIRQFEQLEQQEEKKRVLHFSYIYDWFEFFSLLYSIIEKKGISVFCYTKKKTCWHNHHHHYRLIWKNEWRKNSANAAKHFDF